VPSGTLTARCGFGGVERTRPDRIFVAPFEFWVSKPSSPDATRGAKQIGADLIGLERDGDRVKLITRGGYD
jgi:hypothetical protein